MLEMLDSHPIPGSCQLTMTAEDKWDRLTTFGTMECSAETGFSALSGYPNQIWVITEPKAQFSSQACQSNHGSHGKQGKGKNKWRLGSKETYQGRRAWIFFCLSFQDICHEADRETKSTAGGGRKGAGASQEGSSLLGEQTVWGRNSMKEPSRGKEARGFGYTCRGKVFIVAGVGSSGEWARTEKGKLKWQKLCRKQNCLVITGMLHILEILSSGELQNILCYTCLLSSSRKLRVETDNCLINHSYQAHFLVSGAS